MKLRSPAEFYIKFLVSHPDEFKTDQVIEICEDAGLDSVSPEYIGTVANRCNPPDPFHPNDSRHPRSQRFLIKERIYPLYYPDKAMRTAWKILETPRIKEFVETMILSHAPLLAISDALKRQHSFACTQEAVEHYRHFFWNIDLLDSTQMRTLLHYRSLMVGDGNAEATKSNRALHAAATKAAFMDPRRLAADLPYSPLTALMAQMRMGAMPHKTELAKAVEQVQSMAVLRTAEATLYGSPRDSSSALNFSLVAKNMTEILETIVRPEENLREQLNAIALRTDSRPLPSIHQLSAGRHTVDVQPVIEEVNEPPES